MTTTTDNHLTEGGRTMDTTTESTPAAPSAAQQPPSAGQCPR